jgi:hypothetical protein
LRVVHMCTGRGRALLSRRMIHGGWFKASRIGLYVHVCAPRSVSNCKVVDQAIGNPAGLKLTEGLVSRPARSTARACTSRVTCIQTRRLLRDATLNSTGPIHLTPVRHRSLHRLPEGPGLVAQGGHDSGGASETISVWIRSYFYGFDRQVIDQDAGTGIAAPLVRQSDTGAARQT